jgi:hypothetical protein
VPVALAWLIRPIIRLLPRQAVSNAVRPKTVELSDSHRRMSLRDEADVIRFAVLRAGIDLIRTRPCRREGRADAKRHLAYSGGNDESGFFKISVVFDEVPLSL